MVNNCVIYTKSNKLIELNYYCDILAFSFSFLQKITDTLFF